MSSLSSIIFVIALISLIGIDTVILVALVNKDFQVWPPPQKQSWQYHLNWALFRFTAAAWLKTCWLTWDSFVFAGGLRFGVGLPLCVVGMGIAFYGYFGLGVANTQGLQKGLETGGVYRYSRNPQYTAGIIGFIGTALLVNSVQAVILCALFALLYAMLPFLEEPWLAARYGEAYEHYQQQTPRFLFK